MEALAERSGKVAFDEFVLGADESLGAAGIALARGAAKELAIDPARFVAFGGDDMKAAAFRDAFTELNIRAAASHIRGDSDVRGFSRQRDNGRFFMEANGVEHAKFQASLMQHRCQSFAGGDAAGSDQ